MGLLGDEFQQTLALLLVPAWLVSEWTYRAGDYSGSEVYLARMVAVIAAVYLTAYLHSRRKVVFGILFAVSGVALAITTGFLSEGWRWNYYGYGRDWGFVPVWGDGPCNCARLSKTVEYFIADTAKTPFPLKKGEELWVEVTVPRMGPPRPIQLALSKDGIFTLLNLR
jgi:hypothetical protein